MEIFWQLLAAVAVGWFVSVGSVALGGFLVYKTKREDGRVFMPKGEQPDTAFNLGADEFDTVQPEEYEIPDVVAERNNRFVQQFAENLSEKGADR